MIMRMSDANRLNLINAIATKEGTAQEISKRYGYSIKFLHSFVEANKEKIHIAREEWESRDNDDGELTPVDLDQLWIANKADRVKKLQDIASELYKELKEGSRDAAVLREFRSYCAAVANELGQLLHRGSGDSTGDTLNVDFNGVDIENLR